MAQEIRLLDVNPALDRAALRRRFASNQRIQIRDVLTEGSARNLRSVLSEKTAWGLAWRAGQDGPHGMRQAQLAALDRPSLESMQGKLRAAVSGSEYAFVYAQYPILDAYKEGWAPGGPHDALLELINDQPFLQLVRDVTGIDELVKADAQATLYAPNHFLALHDDSHVAEGWRVAYVLSLCAAEWRPEWGGYLNFYDADGDVVQGFRPRFNALNLFTVPQHHAVTFVPPFAPVARYAITGWLRDR